MYLKRLEIQGFKSFPEKTKLDFTRGITTVVGPNGSGKSNISDAVRWALGEQSAKSLRGGKMEDIIFSGTQNRRALQFAEVSLILDNSDKKMSMEFDEIKVTRRVYRSGEGEYFINGVSCRLKDIYELFMDTGIGKEGYSIIGQGKIDEILSAKSGDRRLLFEEAAGIVKYKNRKTEAENKLEKERLNLTRVEDIIGEIELQLEPLREQSETAKKFLSFSERLKLVQVNIFLREAAGSEEKINALSERVDALNLAISESINKKDETKGLLTQLKNKFDEQNVVYKEYGNNLVMYRSEIEKKENDINLFNEKILHIDKDVARLNSEIEKKQQDIVAKLSVKEGFDKHLISLSGKHKGLENSLAGYQADFDILSEALLESENKLNAFNQQIYEKMNEMSCKKSHLEKLNAYYLQLEEKKEQLNEESENNEELIQAYTKRKTELENRFTILKKEISEINSKCQFYTEELSALQEAKKDKTDELNGIFKKYNGFKARLKLLKELEESYEGYYKSVKAILSQKKEHPESFKGVLGAVGSLLSVTPGYETAIEIALGGNIQNIVTETEYDTKDAINYLKENKLGRATFLPLTAIKPREIGGIRDKLSREQGFLGIAKELISYDEKYENIFSNILGRVIIVNNFDNALLLFKKYDYAYKIVTVDGELLNTGGAITGGAQESAGVKIFGRSREIASLSVQTEELKAVRDKYTTLLETIREKQQSVKFKSSELREELNKINIEKAAITQEAAQLKNSLDNLLTRNNLIKKEDGELLNEIITTNKNIRDAKSQITDCEHDIEAVKNDMKQYQNELAESREEKDIKVKLLTDLKIEIASIVEKLKSTEDNIKRLSDEAEAKLVEVTKSENEIDLLINKKATHEEAVIKTRIEIDEFTQKCGEKETVLTECEKTMAEYTESITEYEAVIEDISQNTANLNNELTRQTLKMEQAQEEIRRLYDLMWDEYEITYTTAKQYEKIEMSARELQSEERAIKSSIKELGNVNVGAITEYREKKERYDFLSTQRQDILNAEESLVKLIKELTALMEEQFREQLTVISYNFNLVFQEMFGGGSAGIMLTDEDNILESGIELIAQPPGKKLQIMSLLSGGERSLTAMALLFAILRMKPSPFCVLDEIDAALDDANVIRYTNYLKNFSHETQFILITHKKGTMVAADALYGVTMQEQGVSKLVSVSLKEA